MYRFALMFVFAVLFTGIAVRLAFGGLDVSFGVAAVFAVVFWWRVRSQWRRRGANRLAP